MLELTTLRGDKLDCKASLISEIKRIPDTLLTFLNGNRIIVKESVDDILDKIIIEKKIC